MYGNFKPNFNQPVLLPDQETFNNFMRLFGALDNNSNNFHNQHHYQQSSSQFATTANQSSLSNGNNLSNSLLMPAMSITARYNKNTKFNHSSILNNELITNSHQNQTYKSNPAFSIDQRAVPEINYTNPHEKIAITGSIFEKRNDWSIISKLPINKQNTIHCRVKDEGPYGNDEIRCFVLAQLSSLKIKCVSCIICSCKMNVYDRFPLVDGTLFLSPFNYNVSKSIPIKNEINGNSNENSRNKLQFMHGICLNCLNSSNKHDTKCKNCLQSWQIIGGSSLQIGTLYKFDVIAAFPCCEQRLKCTKCNRTIIDIDSSKSKYFSSYSREIQCPHCQFVSYHFLKSIESIFLKSECEPILL